MASVKIGAIITDIRGKLGGHVFQNNGAGLIMSTKVSPINHQTPSQRHNRELFRIISQLWRDLTNVQRQGWRNTAVDFRSKDRFSKLVARSGFWLFIKINMNLLLSEQNVILTVPEFIQPQPWLQGAPLLRFIEDDFWILYQGLELGEKITISATPMLSAGISNPLKYLRFMANFLDAEDFNLSFKTEYVARFLYPIVNSNFFIGARITSKTGITTPLFVFNFFQTFNNQE